MKLGADDVYGVYRVLGIHNAACTLDALASVSPFNARG